MGFQSPQFESPLNMMGKLTEMSAAASQNKLAQAKLAAQNADDADLGTVNALAATKGFDINNPAVVQQLNSTPRGRAFLTEYYGGQKARTDAGDSDEKFVRGKLIGSLSSLQSLGDPTVPTPDAPQKFMAWHRSNLSDPNLQTWLNGHGIKPPTEQEMAERINTPQGLVKEWTGSLSALRQLTGQGKPNVTQASTIGGEEFIDDNPESPTFGKTLFRRGSKPPSPGVNIRFGPDESEFAKTIAGDAAKNLGEMQKGARSANSSYSNIERLTPLLNSKAFISGTLGNTRLSIAKALGLEGAEETQTFFSQMGRETAEIIKSFGAGTGLSDNDRIYAGMIAGGNVDLTPGAIKRILFLRQQANRAAIIQYNDERRVAAASNPKANLDQYYRDIPVPPPPSYNYKGWRLETDAQGNMAYVSPDRKSFQETR
jgi:hypothetical protein